jgi:hypothetical protein
VLVRRYVFPAESMGVAGYFLASFLAAVALISELGPREEARAADAGGEDGADRGSGGGAPHMQSRLTLSPRPVSPRPRAEPNNTPS